MLKREFHKELKRSCLEVGQEDPGLPIILERDAGTLFCDLKANLRDIFSHIRDRRRMESSARKKLQPMLFLLEFAIIQYYQLVILSSERNESRTPLLWAEYENQDRPPKPSIVVQCLAANLGNTLLAILDLASDGLDNQARVLFRSFVEIGDMTLALTADQSIFDTFIVTHEGFEDTYRHWRSHLSPRRIKAVLNKIDEEIWEAELVHSELSRHRAVLYQWLSEFAHGGYASIVIGTYSENLYDQDGSFRINIGGFLTAASEGTLSELVFYNWYWIYTFVALLDRKHNLVESIEDLRTAWFVYRCKVFINLFYKTLPLFQEHLFKKEAE